MDNSQRPTIGILSGYQVYGNLSDSQTIEGNSISDYLLRVHQGILNAGRDMDCNILIGCGLGSPPIPEHPFPAWFNWSDDATFVPVGPWNTDGLVVLTPVISQPRQKLLRELRDGGFPIVFCGMGEAPALIADDAEGIRSAVRHLHGHGHRRIAYIAGYENIEGDSAIRLAAYRSTMQELGLNCLPGLVVYGYHTIQGGRNAMQKLLASGQEFSAVVTSDYSSAMGALRVLHEASKRVPEDIALIGFDDYLDARAQTPPVTTVHTQLSEMGYQSVELLLEYIQGRRHEPVTWSVKGQLVIRRSCGCTPQEIQRESASGFTTDIEIARQMAEAALRGAYHLKFDEACSRFAALLQAFRSSLAEQNDSCFKETLNGLLEFVAGRADDAFIIQEALAVFRHCVNAEPALQSSANTGALAEKLLDEASARINEFARGQSTRQLIRKANLDEALDAMTSRLLSTLDESEIPRILREHIPRLGITRAEIAALEPDEDDPIAWSNLWEQGLPAGTSGRRFPTRQFPPAGLYSPESAYQAVLLPLLCHHEEVGYIAFQTGDLEPLAAIAVHVSTAIASARLYKEAQDGRKMAEEANRLKTRFLSTVSHELRTPLNLIVGLSELLIREQKQGKAPTREDLERIYSSSRHLGFLIRDVLDLASSDAGQLRLALEPLELNEVVQGVCATAEQLTGEKGLAWEVKLPATSTRILADRLRLQQVLLNLISNAVKFTFSGKVSLTVCTEGALAKVSVSDTGLGIPPDEQESIFDEFHQSDRTASRGFGGIGLGLSISQHLVRLHGGEIHATSSGLEGEGSTFFFTLPLLDCQAPQATLLPYSDVVLLTDQAGQTPLLREYFGSQGINYIMIAPEKDWLARIVDDPPAAILLDQGLTSRRGWEFLQNLRGTAKLQNIPILMYAVSGQGRSLAVFELDFRTKPLPPDELPGILAGSPRMILIVDDDPNILDLHTRLVQAHLPESRIVHAHSGRDALEILARLHPDLILLDLMMPDLDGFDVLKALQESEANRDIPVVVLTNKVLTDRDMERLNQGVASVLEKGIFTAEETLARLTAALDQHGRSGGASRQVVRRGMAYIHAHCAEPISRETLASHLAVSENYLTNCFQKEIGVSPLAYANRCRIRQARSLLVETNMTVTEIAMSVGFSDPAHFSRVFKKETGFSPLAYRRERSKPLAI